MSRKFTILLSFIVLQVIAAYVAWTGLNRYFLNPFDPSQTQTVLVDATPPKSFNEIARDLESRGIIRSQRAFRIMARINGEDTNIKGGEYELSPAMSPRQILDKMVRGEMFTRRVTIKEGATLADIGAALEDAGITSRVSFDAAVRDATLLKEQGITAGSFEGYLFPETYQFPRNTGPNRIVEAMRGELQKRWVPEWTQRAQILEMNQHQILTLASIIEKESGNFEEQPVISSVFHNRLRKNMRLQADPTVIYGISNFNGNITKKDLNTLTPYNTYMIDGLPPGPISNPGANAIRSALYPTNTNFLYFVGNGEGRHIFSESLDEHVNAVNRYQKNRPSVGSAGENDEHAPLQVPSAP